MITIGTNRIEQADVPVLLGSVPLFLAAIEDGVLLVDFRLTSPPATQNVEVRQNAVVNGPVEVVATGHRVAVRLQGHSVIEVSLENADTVIVSLDLRPLGVAIFTDEAALHIGRSTIAGNVFRVTGAAITVPVG